MTKGGLGPLAGKHGLSPVFLDQVHSDLIHIIEHAPPARPRGDALVTAVPGLLLVIRTADCLPILMADERLRVVAAVHAGWRGTRSRIAAKAVAALVSKFGTNPADLVAALGPCIGPSCYEVGDDVRIGFAAAEFPDDVFRPAGAPGKHFLDLPAANIRHLRDSGVRPDRIAPSTLCTHCDPGSYSWRRDRDPSARMFSFIGIIPV